MTDSMLWTLEEIDAAQPGALHHEITETFRGGLRGFGGVSIDSRTAAPGDLFVAIKGENHDGHDFVPAAIQAGAAAALVSQDRAAPLQGLDLPLIIVPDAFEGLRRLAQTARARTQARIVAVTGSVGKTSTKELIRQALGTKGKTHASARSLNNHWGVPLSLARMPRDTGFGVFEIGMNHAGEIAPLSRLVKPQVVVITHVSEAHLEFFSGLEAIAAAKAELFVGLVAGGTAVIGADHEFSGWLGETAMKSGASRVITYGLSKAADVRVDPQTSVVALEGEKIGLQLNQLGVHARVNAAGALAVALALGVPPGVAALALAQAKAEPGRGVIHHLPGDITLIDESYNANPASMRAALAVLGAQPVSTGSRIAVLGDMLELGERAGILHAQLAKDIASACIDKVFLVGSEIEALRKVLPSGRLAAHTATAEAMTGKLLNSLASGDVVMVKGSNGVRLSGLVEAIIERFGTAGGRAG